MLQSLIRRLAAENLSRLPEPDVRLALAVLMVRIARTDRLYSAEEVERIDRILMHNYGLDPFQASHLRLEAESIETDAPDTIRFTRSLKAATALEDRIALVRSLWSVALADQLRDPEEDQIMRLVTSLLGISDVDSALARQWAEQQ